MIFINYLGWFCYLKKKCFSWLYYELIDCFILMLYRLEACMRWNALWLYFSSRLCWCTGVAFKPAIAWINDHTIKRQTSIQAAKAWLHGKLICKSRHSYRSCLKHFKGKVYSLIIILKLYSCYLILLL